jgi:uncharacterized protein (TIGR02246 family)
MRRAIYFFVALQLSGGGLAFAQDAVGEPPKAEVSPEIKAVRAAIKSYTAAFNKHDAKAVAAHWTEDGEFITPSGNQIRGRANLEKDFAEYFAEAKDAKLELGEPTIQLLSPGVAVEHGSALVVASDRDPIETDYEAIHVKTSVGWKMDSVREKEYVRPQSHYERLQQLEWLIGEWVDADDDAVVETNCRWTKNRNFITRTFKVYVEDRIDLEGTQVIGWDASIGKIRSWMFDSEGGFGVGVWSNRGNRWTVQSLRVLPDGKRGSVTSVNEYVDENTMKLYTVGREVDGELLPNIGPIKVVRK